MELLIRQERIRRKWTQENVAQLIGVTKPAIQMIETGSIKPSFDVLVKLEDLFGMDYRDLFNLPRLVQSPSTAIEGTTKRA